MATAVRWTVHVSPDTDLALRDFLETPNLDTEEASKFIEEAVRWRMLDNDVQVIKDRNQDMPAEELQTIIDKSVLDERKLLMKRNAA
ncbi:MAG: hypothetical protein NTX45_24520 [Proteobacteria bacterium]|nr:hypothetical protein [Pseudomonadota bacterium]